MWGGYYEPGTLIWRSRWVTDDAIVECREALALPSAARPRGDPAPGDRPRRQRPASDVSARPARRASARHALRSAARCEDGAWTGRVRRHPAALDAARARREPGGRRHGGQALTLDLELAGGRAPRLRPRARADGTDDGRRPTRTRAWQATEARLARARARARATRSRRATPATPTRCCRADQRRRRDGRRGHDARCPSAPAQGRNYDYRYVWIRDQCYAGQAVAARRRRTRCSTTRCASSAERLLADGPRLTPAYTVTRRPRPDERQLDLPGYPGGTAIVGNWVNGQFQLDAFGEALLLFAAAAATTTSTPTAGAPPRSPPRRSSERWREPDAGIWEIEPDALDPQPADLRRRAARGSRQHGPRGEQAARWRRARRHDRRRHAPHTRCTPPDAGSARPRDARVDAALLLPAIRGAVARRRPAVASPRCARSRPSSPRTATATATAPTSARSASPKARSCSAASGSRWPTANRATTSAAARWFERNRAACGPPGPVSEEFDVPQRQLRGNLPQAFVHALLLECAVALAA